MEQEFDLSDTYFERFRGFASEFRVDARWILRKNGTEKPYGQLRFVSHPNLRAGYLRAIFTYVISIKKKTKEQKLQMMQDNDVDEMELEIHSVDDTIKTETTTIELPVQELNKMFGVNVFDKK